MVSIGEFSKELCGGTHLDNAGQDRPVEDHRRGERGRRHAADHGPHRPGGPGSPPPRRTPRLAGTAAALARPARRRARAGRGPGQGSPQQAKKQAAAGGRKPRRRGVEQLLADAVEARRRRTWSSPRCPAGPQVLRQLIDQIAPQGGPDRRPARRNVRTRASDVGGRLEPRPGRARPGRGRLGPQAAAALVGGSGGGRADMAQAGGKTPEKLPELAAARRILKSCWGNNADEGGQYGKRARRWKRRALP